MDETVETPTERLRPFWGRIMVIPSDLDEVRRASGLIHPYLGDHTPVKRGVVAHVDKARIEQTESIEELVPGVVVYYIGGLEVCDAIMLNRQEIVAFEVDEASDHG